MVEQVECEIGRSVSHAIGPIAEQRVLPGALNRQREHVLEAVEGLASNDLRRRVLPSAWSCIGLVNHLSLDVERFWFQAVTAGNQIAIEGVLASSDNAWNVSDEEPVEEVLHRYRAKYRACRWDYRQSLP